MQINLFNINYRNLRKKMKKPGKFTRTKLFVVSIVLISVYFFFSHSTTQDNGETLKFFRDNLKFVESMNVSECKLPEYDLYDPEISKYINRAPTTIYCGYLQPYLTYMDWEGYLFLNETEVQQNKFEDLKCTYEMVIGNKNDDYKVFYENVQVISVFPTLIEEPVIRVKCYDGETDIYTMVHSQIRPLPKDRIKANTDIPSRRPSVLIFTIDSMSRGNFIRALPLTYKYLNSRDMTVMNGLNKVADNTFPNMMALLAGFIGYPRSDMAHVPRWTIKENSTIKRYDDMPIIWKTFQNSDYVTMYAEEYLDATFSLLDVGFYNDPVDYYYRSTYVSLKNSLANIHLNKLRFWDRSKWRYCIANEPSYKYMLNYTEEFITEMANMRYFALSFFVEMSHEYLNDVKNMDQDLLNFFKKSFESGLFDNTIVLVMGDHGHRFDDIRSTFIGRIEERMPFLGIVLPKTIQDTYPHLQVNLRSHSERLLSWYDIHEMLVDIAMDDLEEEPKNIRTNVVGKSVFRQFNDTRACMQIGILPEYCMCDREAQIPANSPKAIISTQLILKRINDNLIDSQNYIKLGDNRRCAELKMKRIKSASVSMRSFSSGAPSLLLRVIFEVSPSNGQFEAAVEFLPSEEPHLLGDINRINKYGDQPSCISHDILRMYCYYKQTICDVISRYIGINERIVSNTTDIIKLSHEHRDPL